MSKTEPEYITPAEIARETCGVLSLTWQEKARLRPGWIPYVRAGHRSIVYKRADFRAWMAAHERSHSKDKPKSATAPPGAEAPSRAEGIVSHPDPLEALSRRHRTA